MHHTNIRKTVFNLRERGYSYKYISGRTGLSKSTLSTWLAGVPYRPNTYTVRTIGKARAASGEQKANAKRNSLATAKLEAAKEIGALNKRDVFMFGLGLYLGEGNKTNDIVRIVNSDPRVIRLAIVWFRSLGLTDEHFRLTLHLYPDSDIEKCLQFWSTTTTIPMSQFRKTQIDRRKNKKANNSGKLPFGTIQLSVISLGKKEYGVFLARKILAWIDRVHAKRA